MKNKTWILPKLLLSIIIAASLSACVSSSKFEAMVGERDTVTKERDAARQENAALREEKAALEEQLDIVRKENSQLSALLAKAKQEKLAAAERADQAELEKMAADQLAAESEREKMAAAELAARAEQEKMAAAEQAARAEREKQAAAEKAAQAEAALAQQRDVYSRLQETFAREQQANQIKIEMLKSGIKVNLANEILFSSGSAALNAQGQEVLRRAAVDLKDTPYQILVAGFTDNVPISSTLQKKFPSNWELAGARAASVVRLLEDEGVPAEQLLVLSLGENSPVESNDTLEGRARNRRIEIMLRQVPVTLD